jgi:hypothetical protein
MDRGTEKLICITATFHCKCTKTKGKGKVHPTNCHEGTEGE